jgi:hypothetical protein
MRPITNYLSLKEHILHLHCSFERCTVIDSMDTLWIPSDTPRELILFLRCSNHPNLDSISVRPSHGHILKEEI